MLQVRFRADQKEEAINEAKLIEKTLALGVKVVRETYYPDTNTCEEVTSYVSQKLSSQEASFSPLATSNTVRPRQGAVRRGGGAIPSAAGASSGGARIAPVKRRAPGENIAALLLKLLAIIVLAIGVAITGTAAISSLLGRVGVFGIAVSSAYYPKILFATFASLFLLVAVPLALIFIGGLDARRRRRPRPVVIRAAASKEPPPQNISHSETLLEDDQEATVVVVHQGEMETPRGFVAALMARMNGLFGTSARADSKTRQTVGDQMFGVPIDLPEPTPEPPPVLSDEATAALEIPPDWGTRPLDTVVAPPQPEPAPTIPATPAAEPAGLDRHRMTTVRFLAELLNTLKVIQPSLDAYNRFGVDLIMAGAVDALAQLNTIPEEMSRQMLKECVELLGTKALMAESFCAKVDEYLREPRYLHLVRAGRDMMMGFLNGTDAPFSGLAQALEAWNRPTAKPSAQQIVTVLFTDMVGSTDMTQAKGDAAAQEVVRRHNSIVRQALSEFDGREVKHTGDGIMASFASTANAVDAAIAIQRAVNAHNATTPDIPVHLRIGINAGEPIQEEDDLFGTTVQLAARICAQAQADQVLCSNVVRELSHGRSRRFGSLGEHPLKGFRDPVALYEVIWLDVAVPPADETGAE